MRAFVCGVLSMIAATAGAVEWGHNPQDGTGGVSGTVVSTGSGVSDVTFTIRWPASASQPTVTVGSNTASGIGSITTSGGVKSRPFVRNVTGGGPFQIKIAGQHVATVGFTEDDGNVSNVVWTALLPYSYTPQTPATFSLGTTIQQTTGTPQVRLVLGASTVVVDWTTLLTLQATTQASFDTWTEGQSYKWQFRRGTSGTVQDIASGVIATGALSKSDTWAEPAPEPEPEPEQEAVRIRLNLTGVSVEANTKLKLQVGTLIKDAPLMPGQSTVAWDIPLGAIMNDRAYSWYAEKAGGTTTQIISGTIPAAVENVIPEQIKSATYDGTPPPDPAIIPRPDDYPTTSFPIHGGEGKIFAEAGDNQRVTFVGVERRDYSAWKGKAATSGYGGLTELAPFVYKFKVEGLSGAPPLLPTIQMDLGDGQGLRNMTATASTLNGSTLTFETHAITNSNHYIVRGWSDGKGYGQVTGMQSPQSQVVAYANRQPLPIGAQWSSNNHYPGSGPYPAYDGPWWTGSLATGDRKDHYLDYDKGLPYGDGTGRGYVDYRQLQHSIEFFWTDLESPRVVLRQPGGTQIGQIALEDDTGVVTASDAPSTPPPEEEEGIPPTTPGTPGASGISRSPTLGAGFESPNDGSGMATGLGTVAGLPTVTPATVWPRVEIDMTMLSSEMGTVIWDLGEPHIVTFLGRMRIFLLAIVVILHIYWAFLIIRYAAA